MGLRDNARGCGRFSGGSLLRVENRLTLGHRGIKWKVPRGNKTGFRTVNLGHLELCRARCMDRAHGTAAESATSAATASESGPRRRTCATPLGVSGKREKQDE